MDLFLCLRLIIFTKVKTKDTFILKIMLENQDQDQVKIIN